MGLLRRSAEGLLSPHVGANCALQPSAAPYPAARAHMYRAFDRTRIVSLRPANDANSYSIDGAASTIQTDDCVGMTRCSVKPDSDKRLANSCSVRSRALPNMAIICVSTK